MTATSDQPLAIQRAALEDMHIAARIVSSTASWYRPIVDEEDMAEHQVDETWGRRNHAIREFYIARIAGEPVGIVSYQDAGRHAYIGYVYVDEDHTGKGIGGELLDHVAKLARARRKAGMVLIAHPEAVWAVKAYEKYGFVCRLSERVEVLAWNEGYLAPFYENGFHLFQYDFHPRTERAEAKDAPSTSP